MIAAMLAAVLASTVGATTPAVGSVASVVTADGASGIRAVDPAGDPAVRITLNSQSVYDVGDKARVRVHVRDDSYLLVLHADPSGVVHVLYPTNPGDDDFVRANADVDVQGSGMDASFVVGVTRGTGTVYAAVSKDPFHFDAANSGGRWAASAFPDTARGISAEATLTDVVQRMATPGGRFDYDLVTYTVTPHRAPQSNNYANSQPDGGGYVMPPDGGGYVMPPDWGPYGPYWGAYAYGPWWGYSPYWYSPWYYGPGFYGAGFGIGFGFGFGGCWGCGFYGGYPVVVGYVPGYGYGGPWLHRPGFVPPVGYVTHSVVFASHPSLGGVGYVSRSGIVARPAVFASARLTTAPGGIARTGMYHTAAASSTVLRQVHSVGPAAQPGMGRVVSAGGDRAMAYRATPVPEGGRAAGAAVGTRVAEAPHGFSSYAGGGAQGVRAPARAYRVEPQARSGGEGYEAPRGGEGSGGGHAPRGGGGGGGHARMSSFGGGHFGGGGGHGGGHR